MPDGFDLSYRLVIFDMDGTLADSFPWFVRHVNAVADRFAFRRIAPDEVATLRRLDASRILERLDIPRWKLPLIARHMRALKAQHSDEIALFPGVERMLRQLKDAGAVLAIVSSDAESNGRGHHRPRRPLCLRRLAVRQAHQVHAGIAALRRRRRRRHRHRR
jgi:phosphoglycolate phosphatase